MANQGLTVWINNEAVKKKIAENLGKNAAGFTSALVNIYQNNQLLQKCDGRSILGAGMLAATMGLSISPSLGQAYIVPFKGRAVFQIGWKGLVQLAHRTGRYERLHAGKVYAGELRGFNPLTGEPERGEKLSNEVVGYVAYMRLVNGFEKYLYMTIAEIEEHALKYSQSYAYDKRADKKLSPWSTHFDAMASKTVLKRLLNQWGVLSADMAEAIQADQSVVDREEFTYVDNGDGVQKREELYVPEEDAEPLALTNEETDYEQED